MTNFVCFCDALDVLALEKERTRQKELDTRQKELELDIKNLELVKSRSRTPSGLHTPKSASVSSQSSHVRSAGHYFDELKKHISSKNNMDQYGIILTKYACNIYFGAKSVYKNDGSPESVRNLDIMLSVSGYYHPPHPIRILSSILYWAWGGAVF